MRTGKHSSPTNAPLNWSFGLCRTSALSPAPHARMTNFDDTATIDSLAKGSPPCWSDYEISISTHPRIPASGLPLNGATARPQIVAPHARALQCRASGASRALNGLSLSANLQARWPLGQPRFELVLPINSPCIFSAAAARSNAHGAPLCEVSNRVLSSISLLFSRVFNSARTSFAPRVATIQKWAGWERYPVPYSPSAAAAFCVAVSPNER